MMPSKLAYLLAAPSAGENDEPDEDAVAWVDSKLDEVRDVLEGLVRYHKDDGPCWCYRNYPGHNQNCIAARSLHARLNPDTSAGRGDNNVTKDSQAS